MSWKCSTCARNCKKLEEAQRELEEAERQAEALAAAKLEQEEVERKALEERMALEAKRQAGEAQLEAEAERLRAQALAAELAVLEATRAQQAQIEGLLALGESDLAASRLTTPLGNNALERYRDVLEIEGDNAAALRGLERIVVRYVQLAEQAKAKGKFESARSFLARAQSVLPDSAVILDASLAVEREEAQVLEQQRETDEEADRKERERRRT